MRTHKLKLLVLADTKMPYYGVAKGRSTGVYQSWGDCEDQVKGYPGACFRKFNSASSAHEFVAAHGGGSTSNSQNRSYSGQSYGNSSYYGGYYFEEDSDGYVEVYTDGACLGNGRFGARAGIGVYWGEGHPLNVSEPVTGRNTNNSGEIQAATRAMELAVAYGIKNLAINTDSKFLIRAATEWMPGWKQAGWRLPSGGPVKNEQDFKKLDRAQNRLNVKWVYVEAHQGIEGNEMADQLARAGASMS